MDDDAKGTRVATGSGGCRTLGPLDELLEELARRSDPEPVGEGALPGIDLANGRRLDVLEDQAGTSVRITNPEGATEVTIELTAEGPRVSVNAVALDVACAGEVAVDCEAFDVRARRRVELHCDRGDICLDAGDDVVVTGERIRLN